MNGLLAGLLKTPKCSNFDYYDHPLPLKKKNYRKKKKKKKVVEEMGSSMEAPFDYLSTHKHFHQDNLDKSKRKVEEVDLS